MFTTKEYEMAIEALKGIDGLTKEQVELIKKRMAYQICDIKVGDMVSTPKGEFEVVAVLDNGDYMPNNFIETKSDRVDMYHMFRVADCVLI